MDPSADNFFSSEQWMNDYRMIDFLLIVTVE
jgi:hypothetical protein